MPELNHKLHAGRMNKDLDERLVPNGEYRDALNIEVGTSEGSDIGSMQTLMGNINLSNFDRDDFYCVGSIVNEKEDKIYWLISGTGIDIIAEYSYKTKQVKPVVVDIFTVGTSPGNKSGRVLNFDKSLLITGINIIDDMLFWTDNYTEPKRINITRCKMGSIDFQTHTQLYIRDVTVNVVSPDKYINSNKPLKHEHITVIKKSPSTAPVLEMQGTKSGDENENSIFGEITTTITIDGNPMQDPVDGEFIDPIRIWFLPPIGISSPSGQMVFDDPVDYKVGDTLIISTTDSNNITYEIRVKINVLRPFVRHLTGWELGYIECQILAGNPSLINSSGIFEVRLEQESSLFEFKFPRFASRYKYEDGEYSAFSPFTDVAFLPGEFDYLPKEGYNLGMVNNLRVLGIKDFVDERLIPDDVISIDILYKESNSPNVYSVKTIKRTNPDPTGESVDEWNAKSSNEVNTFTHITTKGFLDVTSEMIHAVLPSNQLLRPYDNIPRRALAQEITGNRIVYGNYLQNYNLSNQNQVTTNALITSIGNYGITFAPEDDIKVNLKTELKVNKVGNVSPAQYDAKFTNTKGNSITYGPAKSIKTLRTYQLGVVYIDEFGRETPVFSDSIHPNSNSYRVEKASADKATRLAVQNHHTYPEWAESFKFFVKETSSEYYNLAMDRWYEAEDGNIWLTFPSSERNKVDLETFLILKKEHDNDAFVPTDIKYKILAIENEAPLFVKTEVKLVGSFFDDNDSTNTPSLIGTTVDNFPLPGNALIKLEQAAFETLGWAKPSLGTTSIGTPGEEGSFYLQDYELFQMRFVSGDGFSGWYNVTNVGFDPAGYYSIYFEKTLDQDVSITSPITEPLALAQVYQNIEVQLAKKTVINRPEYDGRFFAKIKKDLSIIDSIVKPNSYLTSDYYSIATQKVQYINFEDQKSSTGSTPEEHYSWYGIEPEPDEGWKISTSWDSGVGTDYGGRMSVGTGGGSIRGQGYWRKAGKNDPDLGGAGVKSESSGWFIDKIEGFRPFNSDAKYFGKGANAKWEAVMSDVHGICGPSGEYVLQPDHNTGYGLSTDDLDAWLEIGDGAFEAPAPLVEGTNTMPGYLDSYLGIGSVRSPEYILLRDFKSTSTNPAHAEIGYFNEGRLQEEYGLGVTPSSGIIPSLGIYNNIIHISHSGIGIDEVPGWRWAVDISGHNFWHKYTDDWAESHRLDVEFINALTTPGSIWRWREDPGKCIYQTVSYDSTTPDYVPNTLNAFPPLYSNPPFEIDGALWNYNTTEQYSEISGYSEQGIGLYNHMEISDYYRSVWCNYVDWGGLIGVVGTLNNANAQNTWGDSNLGDHLGSNSITNILTHGTDGDNSSVSFYSAISWMSAVPMQSTNGWAHHFPDIRTCGNWSNEMLGHTIVGALPSDLNDYPNPPGDTYHYNSGAGKWPMKTHRWHEHSNKRRRYQIYAKSLEKDTGGLAYDLGKAPAHGTAVNPGIAHGYLPTNPPFNTPHFHKDSTSGVVTVYTNGSGLPATEAPGIRPDGMHTGYVQPASEGGTGPTDYIPQYYTSDDAAVPANGDLSNIPGSVTWQILSSVSPLGTDEHIQSTNPAIWETEPKETTDLDIYHEIGQVYPINLDFNNIEQFVGPVSEDLIENSKIKIWRPGTGFISISSSGGSDVRVYKISNLQICINLADVNGTVVQEADIPQIEIDDRIIFIRADGSQTETNIIAINEGRDGVDICLDPYVHNFQVTLPWHNCYSFGNGIESDRIRDDYNQVTIDNGPKASTTLDEPYLEERRASGLIYSGIYNSTSGINNLNQFIAAEKITKDLNPIYGSIQKLHTRNTNLLTLCEDKVFKILANKDALYNADGSLNLTATENVLGQATPLLGEYGISKNPESFASESYRNYFTDKTRGAVIRLSQDGMTPISDVGMRDYFADSLRNVGRIYGSIDDKKQEYNLTLDYSANNIYNARIIGSKSHIPTSTIVISTDYIDNFKVGDLIQGAGIETGSIVVSITTVTDPTYGTNLHVVLSKTPTIVLATQPDFYINPTVTWDTVVTVFRTTNLENATLSFSEITKGWTSFKSWLAEDGVSLNSEYYTFKGGNLWKHHQDIVDRNNFYGVGYDSSVEVLFNELSGSVKSFQTLNYEGSQSKITPPINPVTGEVVDGEYWDNELKEGWYVSKMYTDMQQADEHEFKEKEGKWFSQIQGVSTEWLGDGTAGNIDTNEFSYQGIDESGAISIVEGDYTSWDCENLDGQDRIWDCIEKQGQIGTLEGGIYTTKLECENAVNTPCSPAVESWNCIVTDGSEGPSIANCELATAGTVGDFADLASCLLACNPCVNPILTIRTEDATTTVAGGVGFCQNDGTIKITANTLGTTWGYLIEDTVTGLGIASNNNIPSNSSIHYNFLSEGTYTVTVTDDLGCVTVRNFTINCIVSRPDCPTTGPYYSGSPETPNSSPHNIQVVRFAATNATCDDGGLALSIGTLGNGATSIMSISLYDTCSGSNVLINGPNTTIYPPFVSTAPIINLNSNPGHCPYLFEVMDDVGCTYLYDANVGCTYSAPTYNCAEGESRLTGYDSNGDPVSIPPYSCYDPVYWNVSGVPSPGIYTDATALLNGFSNALAECEASCERPGGCPPQITPANGGPSEEVLDLGTTIVNASCPGCDDGILNVILNGYSSYYTPAPTQFSVSLWEEDLSGNMLMIVDSSTITGLTAAVPASPTGPPAAVTPITGLQAGNYEYRIEMTGGAFDGCIYTYPFVLACEGCIDPSATNYCGNATIDDGSCEYCHNATVNIIQDATGEPACCIGGDLTLFDNCNDGGATFVLNAFAAGSYASNYTVELWWGGNYMNGFTAEPYYQNSNNIFPSFGGDPYAGVTLYPGDVIEYSANVNCNGNTANSFANGPGPYTICNANQEWGLVGQNDDVTAVYTGNLPNPWAVQYWVRVTDDTGEVCDYYFMIDCPSCVSGNWCQPGGGGTSWGPGCMNPFCGSYSNPGPNSSLPCFQDPFCNGYGNIDTSYPCTGNSLPWDCGNY